MCDWALHTPTVKVQNSVGWSYFFHGNVDLFMLSQGISSGQVSPRLIT